MIITFQTESGSSYTVNTTEKTWKRPVNPKSMGVRDTEGTYEAISEIMVGRPVLMVCPPREPGFDARFISTTLVTGVRTE